MIVYTIVFKYFFHVKPAPGVPSGLNVYALFLLCALLPWNFFQISVMGCIGSLIGNESLIKKTYFPRELLPGATVGGQPRLPPDRDGPSAGRPGRPSATGGPLVYLPFVLLLTLIMAHLRPRARAAVERRSTSTSGTSSTSWASSSWSGCT